jgi:transketolase
MRDVFVDCLIEYASNNAKFCLITADLGFGVFDEYKKRFPGQFLNVGVAEQNMAAIASGMALEGWKIVMYSIGNFPTFRCLEQIRNDICYHNLDVKVIGMGAGFSYGILGMSHHATEDIAIMRVLPNMKIYAPSGVWDTKQIVQGLLEESGPGYLRLEKSAYEHCNADKCQLFLGKGTKLLDGDDITIISIGSVLSEVMLAAAELNKSGVSPEILSYHSIRPFDKRMLSDSINKTECILTVEEHSIIGGLGSAVAEICMDENHNVSGFRRIGLREKFSKIVGDTGYLRKEYCMDSKSIYDAAISLTEAANEKRKAAS